MAVVTGIASLKAGLMVAAPVLAVAAPLVLAALFLQPETAPTHTSHNAPAQSRVAVGSRTTSVLMPALAAPPKESFARAQKGRPGVVASARSSKRRGARAANLAGVGAVLTRASVSAGGQGCAKDGLQSLACGGAPALRSAIQAQLSYNHLNTNCAGILTAYGRGGLEGSLIYSINSAQLTARRSGLTRKAEEAQIKRALQQALVVSGSAPKDVLSALSDLEAVYGGCEGYDSARNALLGTAAVIQSQLGFDRPTAVSGFGAALANPGLPAAGTLGAASYSR